MKTTAVATLLAADINAEHEAACRAMRSGLEHARRAGDLLIQAKTSLEHGAWLPWLAEHCPTLSERTAQGYMRIARRWPEFEDVKAQRVADLPLRQAMAILAEPLEKLPAALPQVSQAHGHPHEPLPENLREGVVRGDEGERDPAVTRILDQLDKLLGLIRWLTWERNARVGARQRRCERAIASVLREMEPLGWADEAQSLVEYCDAMPAFGRDQGVAFMHRLLDVRITTLTPVEHFRQ